MTGTIETTETWSTWNLAYGQLESLVAKIDKLWSFILKSTAFKYCSVVLSQYFFKATFQRLDFSNFTHQLHIGVEFQKKGLKTPSLGPKTSYVLFRITEMGTYRKR